MKILAVGLLLMQICSVVKGIVTSCEDVSVYLGDSANITCVFSEDINQTRTGDFRVYRYDLYSRTEKEVLVLDCYWSDGAKCQTAEGYSFDKTVSSRLTVGISHANETHEGRYECQVQPTDPANVKQCRLTLKAGIKPTPSPGPTTSATLTTEAANKHEKGGTHAAAIVVPIILVLIILVCAGLAYKCREKIFKRFPGLRFWETPEDPASAAERAHATTESESESESEALLDQAVPRSKKDPLQHDQQPKPESEMMSLVRVSTGDRPVINEEPVAGEGDEKFWDAVEELKESDKHSANKGSAPGDKTFTPTSEIKITAHQPADDTEKYEHENASKASLRDSEGSFHQTLAMNTGIPYTQETPEILPMSINKPEKEKRLLDTEKKDMYLPARIKHPIQASDDAESNGRKNTEVNIQEIHTAASPDEAVDDSTNTDEPAAHTNAKFKKKDERYATSSPEMKAEGDKVPKDTPSKPGCKDKEGDTSDADCDSDDNGANGANANTNTTNSTALLQKQLKGQDETNATANAEAIQRLEDIGNLDYPEKKEANESNDEDNEGVSSSAGSNDDNGDEGEESADADNDKDNDDNTDADHTS